MSERRGISLIETMVALLVLGVIGVALVALMAQIQSAANSAKFRNLSVGYAQAMVEQFKDLKNQGWSEVTAKGAGCYEYETLVAVTCPASPSLAPALSVNSLFKGYVQLVAVSSPPGFRVRSFVYWTEKGKTETTEIDSYLYDY